MSFMSPVSGVNIMADRAVCVYEIQIPFICMSGQYSEKGEDHEFVIKSIYRNTCCGTVDHYLDYQYKASIT